MEATDTAHLKLKTNDGTIPLAFVKSENDIFLASRVKGTRWPSNILRQGIASIELEGKNSAYSASLLTELDAKNMIMQIFVQKYGEENTLRWYGKDFRIIRLRAFSVPETPGKQRHYYSWLESEFDAIAHSYDHHIYDNSVNSLLRERSIRLMQKTFQSPGKLLEIGCGTGTETLEILKAGHEVVAVDISQNMLDSLKLKAEKAGLISNLTLVKMNAVSIGELANAYGPGFFDGIYSTYGALNCVTEIERIPASLHELLKREGKLVLGIYNRLCVSEILGYAAKGKFRHAVARLKKEIREGDSRFCIDIYAYTFMEIREIFHEFFSPVYVEGVPIIIPPSNFVNYVDKFRNRFELVKRMDQLIGSRWPFTILGDHFLTVMEPNPTKVK